MKRLPILAIMYRRAMQGGVRPARITTLARAAALAAVLVAALALRPFPARAAESESRQVMAYQLYASGINAVQSRLIAETDKGRYNLFLSARTYGFLGKIVPWQGSFESVGWQESALTLRPEKHESVAVWQGEEEVKTYAYGRDQSFKGLTITEDGVDKSPKDLPADLTQGTTDAMTAAFIVMKRVGAGGECEGSSQVFDGKRRFRIVFRQTGSEFLRASRYNVYEGPSARCEVEIEPIAGGWHKKPRGWLSIQEQGRKKGALPTIWFARIEEGKPAVPVKMKVATEHGVLFMHLTRYQSGGTVFSIPD